MHKTGREKFWELLPSLFGLPPWEELNKEREMYALIPSMLLYMRSLMTYADFIENNVDTHNSPIA